MRSRFVEGIVTGITATTIVGILVVFALLQMDEVADMSEVGSPTGAMIRDLKKTVDAGDWALAQAKLDSLDERWRQFRKGGPPPGSFQREVTRLKLSDDEQ